MSIWLQKRCRGHRKTRQVVRSSSNRRACYRGRGRFRGFRGRAATAEEEGDAKGMYVITYVNIRKSKQGVNLNVSHARQGLDFSFLYIDQKLQGMYKYNPTRVHKYVFYHVV
jgi:hypothetical protein